MITAVGSAVFYGSIHSPVIRSAGEWTVQLNPMFPQSTMYELRRQEPSAGMTATDEEPRRPLASVRLFSYRRADGSEVTWSWTADPRWALMLFFALYYTLFTWLWQRTPGKHLMGLRVERPDGGPPSLPRSLGRWLAYVPATLLLYLGLLWIFVDRQQRGWHDRLVGTRVVRVG